MATPPLDIEMTFASTPPGSDTDQSEPQPLSNSLDDDIEIPSAQSGGLNKIHPKGNTLNQQQLNLLLAAQPEDLAQVQFKISVFIKEMIYHTFGIVILPFIIYMEGLWGANNRYFFRKKSQGIKPMTIFQNLTTIMYVITAILQFVYQSLSVWDEIIFHMIFFMRNAVISAKYAYYPQHVLEQLRTQAEPLEVHLSRQLNTGWAKPPPSLISSLINTEAAGRKINLHTTKLIFRAQEVHVNQVMRLANDNRREIRSLDASNPLLNGSFCESKTQECSTLYTLHHDEIPISQVSLPKAYDQIVNHTKKTNFYEIPIYDFLIQLFQDSTQSANRRFAARNWSKMIYPSFLFAFMPLFQAIIWNDISSFSSITWVIHIFYFLLTFVCLQIVFMYLTVAASDYWRRFYIRRSFSKLLTPSGYTPAILQSLQQLDENSHTSTSDPTIQLVLSHPANITYWLIARQIAFNLGRVFMNRVTFFVSMYSIFLIGMFVNIVVKFFFFQNPSLSELTQTFIFLTVFGFQIVQCIIAGGKTNEMLQLDIYRVSKAQMYLRTLQSFSIHDSFDSQFGRDTQDQISQVSEVQTYQICDKLFDSIASALISDDKRCPVRILGLKANNNIAQSIGTMSLTGMVIAVRLLSLDNFSLF